MKTPNQRLKAFREKAGLRQEAIAAELDLSLSLLQKVEAGGKEVSDKMADALNRRYQVPVEWLMEGRGDLTYSLEKENPYRDYTLQHFEKEIAFLRGLVETLSGKKANFPLALNKTGLPKKRLLGAAA